MKIVIFGSTGMLGRYLVEHFTKDYDVICCNRNDVDLSCVTEYKLKKYFTKEVVGKGDVVINCAVLKSGNCDLMFMVNSVFPHLLNLFDMDVIHISTDGVFSGNDGNYDEQSIVDCIDKYGITKYLGENCDQTVIRTSIIGDGDGKTFIGWLKENSSCDVYGYNNHLWNGVTCFELVKYIESLVKTKMYWKGIRHIFSPGVVTKYELIGIIDKIYNLDINIKEDGSKLNCYRNLKSIFKSPITKSLYDQIYEMRNYN